MTWYGPGKAQNTALNENLDPTLVANGDSAFLERGASVYEAKTTYVDLSGESFFELRSNFLIKNINLKEQRGLQFSEELETN